MWVLVPLLTEQLVHIDGGIALAGAGDNNVLLFGRRHDWRNEYGVETRYLESISARDSEAIYRLASTFSSPAVYKPTGLMLIQPKQGGRDLHRSPQTQCEWRPAPHVLLLRTLG